MPEGRHHEETVVTADVIFADENLLENILLQGGVAAVLAAPPVCQAFNVACKSPSLWRHLKVPGRPSAESSESSTSSAAGYSPSQLPLQAAGDERELYRQHWENARWASGKLQPPVDIVPLIAPGIASGFKIASAACFSDLVCIGGGKEEHSIRCFDLSGALVKILHGHTFVRILASCEQQQRRWLASAGGNKDIRLWNVDDGTTNATSKGTAPIKFQFDPRHVAPTMEFFRASEQAVPSLFLNGNYVVDWRPDGTAVLTARHNLCNLGTTSIDEPSIALGAYSRGIFRMDLREPPPIFEHSLLGGFSFEGNRWTNSSRDQFAIHPSNLQWLRADSQRIVGAGSDGLAIWDVRRPGEPIATINVCPEPRSFEAAPYRAVKDIDLASRGRLVVTTYNVMSANQGLVSLWDLSDLSKIGDTPQPTALKMRLPKPRRTRSIVMSRVMGRQTIMTLLPAMELYMWKVGSNVADDVGL